MFASSISWVFLWDYMEDSARKLSFKGSVDSRTSTKWQFITYKCCGISSKWKLIHWPACTTWILTLSSIHTPSCWLKMATTRGWWSFVKPPQLQLRQKQPQLGNIRCVSRFKGFQPNEIRNFERISRIYV